MAGLDYAAESDRPVVLEKIRLAGNPEYWQMTPAQAREWHNRKAGILDIKPEPVHEVEDRVVRATEADVPVRIYTPRASQSPLPILVWLHGGGHVVGKPRTATTRCAASSRCRRTASSCRSTTGSRPSTSFPPGVVDSFAALKWAAAHAARDRRRSVAHRDRRRQRGRQPRRGVRDPRARCGRARASCSSSSSIRARRPTRTRRRITRSPKATCSRARSSSGSTTTIARATPTATTSAMRR